jgi:hypothetical protein
VLGRARGVADVPAAALAERLAAGLVVLGPALEAPPAAHAAVVATVLTATAADTHAATILTRKV